MSVKAAACFRRLREQGVPLISLTDTTQVRRAVLSYMAAVGDGEEELDRGLCLEVQGLAVAQLQSEAGTVAMPRTPAAKRVTPKPSPEPDVDPDDGDDDEPDDALIRCKSPGCGLKSAKGARYCARCGASLNQGTEPAGGDDDAALKAELAKLDRQVRIRGGDRKALAEATAPTFYTPTTSAPIRPLVLSRNLEGRPAHENMPLRQREERAQHLIRAVDGGLRPPSIDSTWFPPSRQ
jgi:hypothetical protein